MCIQQVPDCAHPDQIIVIERFDIIVAPALVQPRVDVGDWSWSTAGRVWWFLLPAKIDCNNGWLRPRSHEIESFRIGYDAIHEIG